MATPQPVLDKIFGHHNLVKWTHKINLHRPRGGARWKSASELCRGSTRNLSLKITLTGVDFSDPQTHIVEQVLSSFFRCCSEALLPKDAAGKS